jgi:hypothetical protein
MINALDKKKKKKLWEQGEGTMIIWMVTKEDFRK